MNVLQWLANNPVTPAVTPGVTPTMPATTWQSSPGYLRETNQSSPYIYASAPGNSTISGYENNGFVEHWDNAHNESRTRANRRPNEGVDLSQPPSYAQVVSSDFESAQRQQLAVQEPQSLQEHCQNVNIAQRTVNEQINQNQT